MDIDKIVIGKIFRLIEERGTSQRQLAKDAKINYQNLNRLLKNHRSITKSDILPDIARALGVTTEYLKSVDIASVAAAPEAESKSTAELILEIQSLLTTMDESQLETLKMTAEGLIHLKQPGNMKKAKE